MNGVVPPAGVTVVVGPSGAGKSTLLRLCNRLEVPSSGVVRHRGDDIATLDPLELRRHVGMVFQRPTPFAGTVLDNLGVAQPDISYADAVQALERVQLDSTFVDLPATELSGGEAQRVCLARTLVTKPEVVLMDEPASSVDPTTKRALEQLARGLAEAGTAVVWVTHDLEQMRRIADHVLVVIDGSIAHAAPFAELDANAPPSAQRFLAEEAA